MEDYSKEDRYLRAKERVKKLKGFYWHLAVYIIVNMFLTIGKITGEMSHGKTFIEAFWDFGTFAIWVFWGIGVFFHGLKVFGPTLFFGKDWEQRKMNEFIDEDKQQWQ